MRIPLLLSVVMLSAVSAAPVPGEAVLTRVRLRVRADARLTVAVRGTFDGKAWSSADGFRVAVGDANLEISGSELRRKKGGRRYTWRGEAAGVRGRLRIDPERGRFRARLRNVPGTTGEAPLSLGIRLAEEYVFLVPRDPEKRRTRIRTDLRAEPKPVGPLWLLPSTELTSGPDGWPGTWITRETRVVNEDPPSAGAPAVDFTLKTVSGVEHRLADLLMTRPVLIVCGAFT